MRCLGKILSLVILASFSTSTTFAATVMVLAGGGDHACAISDGGGSWCWGYNNKGQLGDNSTVNKRIPVAVSGLGSGVMSVAASENHTCALTSTGGVKCWGNNWAGQLGDGSVINKLTPVPVSGLNSGVVAIAAGNAHTCALTGTGGVLCWGYNFYGQLGDNSKLDKYTPVAVSGLGSGVAAIAAGNQHTCALTNVGAVWCWGSNGDGQLGDNTGIQRLVPVAVSGLGGNIRAIAAGLNHMCALTDANGVRCWGANHNGQLGDNTTTNRYAPVDVSGLSSGANAVAAGWFHSCAVMSGGTAQCWGRNKNGQLGDGSINVNSPYGKLTPVSVNDLGGSITAMVAGSVYTCALTSMGGVQCWGGNGVGELGDNSTTDRLAPVWLVGFEDFNGGAGDAFPYNNAASIDTDHDGMPDNWNASCNTACQSGSGLVLDSDDDDDGIPDVIDPVLSWMPLTVNGSYRGASVAENNQRQ